MNTVLEYDSLQYSSLVPFPRLKRAKKLVPSEFLRAYDWFLANEGSRIDRLPYGQGTPDEIGFPLARQAGIHSPSVKTMSYPEKRYVLSVHSSNLDRYPDKSPIALENGTWIIEYSAQDNSIGKTKQDYNGWLMNCLHDGIPVGVMTKSGDKGYTVQGLAFVESYNPISHSFLLHGPVNPQTECNGYFDFAERSSLTRSEIETFDAGSETEQQRTVLRVQRAKQDAFRKMLISAYGSRCSVTGTNVPEVLQAAHIEPYRGIRTQTVDNGILLRADIHLLYDSRLLSIKPHSHTVELHHRLATSDYAPLQDRRILLPEGASQRPSDLRLSNQYKLFQVALLNAS